METEVALQDNPSVQQVKSRDVKRSGGEAVGYTALSLAPLMGDGLLNRRWSYSIPGSNIDMDRCVCGQVTHLELEFCSRSCFLRHHYGIGDSRN